MVATNRKGQQIQVLTRKDFVSDQDVRWCPGCGDYSILAQMQKMMPELGHPAREHRLHLRHRLLQPVSLLHEHLRLPQHPRPRPDDRDRPESVAAGPDRLGRHRRRRRPVDRRQPPDPRPAPQRRPQDHPLQQRNLRPDQGPVLADLAASARRRSRRRSASIDRRSIRSAVALGAEATFVARTIDVDTKHLATMLGARHQHKRHVASSRSTRTATSSTTVPSTTSPTKRSSADHLLFLEHGKPLIFGKDRDKGIRLNGMKIEVVQLGNGITETDLLVHDEKRDDPTIAFLLSRMDYPEYPVPVGVIRAVQRPTYEGAHERADRRRPSLSGRGRHPENFSRRRHLDRHGRRPYVTKI